MTKKVQCNKCLHFIPLQVCHLVGHTFPARCRKNPTIEFDPVEGNFEVKAICKFKNKNGDCKDFELAPEKISWWKRIFK
jgi:hypothetical protein